MGRMSLPMRGTIPGGENCGGQFPCVHQRVYAEPADEPVSLWRLGEDERGAAGVDGALFSRSETVFGSMDTMRRRRSRTPLRFCAWAADSSEGPAFADRCRVPTKPERAQRAASPGGQRADETSLRACAAKIASPELVVFEGAVNQDEYGASMSRRTFSVCRVSPRDFRWC